MRYLYKAVAATAMALAAASAAAADFPTRPIRIVIGFPPGGAIDTIARTIAPRMAESMGQSVLIDNRPGAGGVIGTQAVARAEPDGYTVFMGTMGNFAITPSLMTNLTFSIEKDFDPVTLVASSGFVIYVNPKVPVNTVDELVAYARERPGQVHFSSSGNGGLPHMAAEMFNSAAGVEMVHVPYKGSSPSINDLVAGQVQLTFEAAAIGIPFVQAGRLRAIATTGEQRLAALPDVPTVNETLPGFVVTNWFGMAVPAGTPPAVIDRLQQEVHKAIYLPEVQATLQAQGVEPVADSPQAFASFLHEETERWAKVIKDADIKME
ncbi:tripartite tricarboxylate transporter substrate binding protein [Verticiella sediminum]|uniref:Tripartite tricarboxylate transporter substrate binding protein n=1 Tax=Verticiella sediminum TaxID=1247510 RepID=A0A556AJC9_9BURK|nr:tripartite tricarboxylate transporter substrate binding protein [Verticiella sediminum]TSH93014.1 tripartite tricarboxylate transporter substrate binding protein [Verticiella sediminum]